MNVGMKINKHLSTCYILSVGARYRRQICLCKRSFSYSGVLGYRIYRESSVCKMCRIIVLSQKRLETRIKMTTSRRHSVVFSRLHWSARTNLHILSSFRTCPAVAHGCYSYALIRSLPVTVYILLVTGLRYHLFIWSVFSPKLLYEVIYLVISAGVCVTFTVVDKNQVAKSDVWAALREDLLRLKGNLHLVASKILCWWIS